MKAVIFVGSGKIAYGKLSQALEYGALTVQIAGDFDDAMARVQEVAKATTEARPATPQQIRQVAETHGLDPLQRLTQQFVRYLKTVLAGTSQKLGRICADLASRRTEPTTRRTLPRQIHRHNKAPH